MAPSRLFLGAATAALAFWLGWGVLFADDDFGSPGRVRPVPPAAPRESAEA
ncbi:hypothetical protein [Streptomyces sp. NPDC059166]|uniref:hypothetical protein n=1 Tax=Streptomyces sp. NPDC059166 TaxID=3346752 RepID=UPI0036AC2E7A